MELRPASGPISVRLTPEAMSVSIADVGCDLRRPQGVVITVTVKSGSLLPSAFRDVTPDLTDPVSNVGFSSTAVSVMVTVDHWCQTSPRQRSPWP